LRSDLSSASSTIELRLLDRTGQYVPAEITLKNIRWQKREYQIGFVRTCQDRLRRESQLRDQVERQKQRAVTALKSSLRVYELNEKIKSTLVLTTKLLNVENEEQLFKEALRLLTSEEGLNFRDGTFLVLENGELNTVCSTMSSEHSAYSLSEDNKFSRFIRKGLSSASDEPGDGDEDILVPLQSREILLGLVQVYQYPREKAFFSEYRQITEWQKDMLVRIGDIIAMILDNLRLKRELKRQSIVDVLTGAYNRNFFMNRMSLEVRRARRYNRPVSLVFIDVDHFKPINDCYGHLQGDQVLRDLGKVLREHIRETDILCRYGGDEFVVLLPETDTRMAGETAEKLVHAVREHHFANLDDPGQRVPLTISVGVTSLQPAQNEEQFLQTVDTALYRAKKAGRNQAAALTPTGAELEPVAQT
jgi:diguanylate cyclase (GGDEF)-like protein